MHFVALKTNELPRRNNGTHRHIVSLELYLPVVHVDGTNAWVVASHRYHCPDESPNAQVAMS